MIKQICIEIAGTRGMMHITSRFACDVRDMRSRCKLSLRGIKRSKTRVYKNRIYIHECSHMFCVCKKKKCKIERNKKLYSIKLIVATMIMDIMQIINGRAIFCLMENYSQFQYFPNCSNFSVWSYIRSVW